MEREETLLYALKWPSSNPFFAAILIALTLGTASAPLAWTYTTGNYLWAVAVSRDGRYAIAGSDDMRAYFFNTKSAEGEPLWSHAAHGYVRDVAISRNGTRAAASDTDGNVFFFRRPDLSGEPVWSYRSDYPIEALAMSEEGDYLVAGDRAGSVYLFKTGLTEPLIMKSMIPGGVLALSLSKSNAVAATSASGGLYFFSEASSPSYVWSFQEYATFPYLAMGRDAGYIVAAGSGGYVYMINSSGQLMDRQSLGGAVSALAVSYRAHLVVAGSANGRVSLYRLSDRLEKLSSLEARRPVTSAALSDDGERISVATLDGVISMFDQSLTDKIWTFNAGAIVHSLSISADGRIMAAGSDTGSIYLFDETSVRSGRIVSYLVLAAVAVIAIVAGFAIWRKRRKRIAEI